MNFDFHLQIGPKATDHDRAFLLTLRKLTMVEHLEKAGLYLSNEEHEFRLNDAYDCCHLIRYADKNIGLLKYREYDNKIEVMQIQIHPGQQNKGFGKMVLNRVLLWSKEKHKNIELSVLKNNPAILLYEKLGFLITGEDKYEFHMQLRH